MTAYVYYVKKVGSEIRYPYGGYIEIENFDAEECFNLLNWFHWAEEKPENVFSKIDSCGSGIIFYNPEEHELHLALPMGWAIFKSWEKLKEDVCKYIDPDYNTIFFED